MRAFGPDLIKAAAENRAADLVNISSVAAHVPLNVRVSNIEPGLTNTELGSHIDNDAHAASLSSIFDAVAGLEAADIADLVGFLTSRPRQVHLRQTIIGPTLLPA